MKKNYLLFLILALCFSIQSLSATNPISLESYEVDVVKTQKKASVFTNAKIWFKNAVDEVKIKKLAKAALIIGIVSLAGWIFIAFGVGFSTMLLFMGLLALVADILAIMVLVKTSKEKSAHKKSRKMAVWGLVTGLLTGLIPLLAFLIVLIALALAG